jgi:hypothetical protein
VNTALAVKTTLRASSCGITADSSITASLLKSGRRFAQNAEGQRVVNNGDGSSESRFPDATASETSESDDKVRVMTALQRLNKVLGSALVFAFYPWLASSQPVVSPPHATDVQMPGKQILLDDGRGLIHLDVVVTDRSGRPVPGLRLSDFTLFDNGHPQKILSFHAFDEVAKPNPPVKIILVVDALALPGRLPSDERLAVEAYLQKTEGHPVQPVSLYELDGSGFWAVGSPSDDGNILAADLAHSQNFHELRSFRSTLRGDTWKWLDQNDTPSLEALKALGQIAATERQLSGRKLLIWVGPGWGIGTGAYADRTVSKDDTFYAIRWFSSLLREARITCTASRSGKPNRLSFISTICTVYLPPSRPAL